MEFIFSLINAISLFAMGFVVIKFRREIKKWTGTMTSIERHLGRGSTYFIIILVGLGFMVLGILWPFGVKDVFLS